eukprot:COSAG01_NODE_954_length_12493_cov_8.138454_3_plen_339_part_00
MRCDHTVRLRGAPEAMKLRRRMTLETDVAGEEAATPFARGGLSATELLGAGQSVLGGAIPDGGSLRTGHLTDYAKHQLKLKEVEAMKLRRRMAAGAKLQREDMHRRQSRERERLQAKISEQHQLIEQEKRAKQEEERQQIIAQEQELEVAYAEKMQDLAAQFDQKQRAFAQQQATEYAKAVAQAHDRSTALEQRSNEVAALKRLFCRMNTSGTGWMSYQEAKAVCIMVHSYPTPRELRSALKEFGNTKITRVSFSAFLRWWDSYGAKGKGQSAQLLRVTRDGNVSKRLLPLEGGKGGAEAVMTEFSATLWGEYLGRIIDSHEEHKGTGPILSGPTLPH